MTKEIQKLAEQAGYNGHYCTEEFDLEMFAELIVKECILTVENSEGDTDYAIWKIKKDFGIEE